MAQSPMSSGERFRIKLPPRAPSLSAVPRRAASGQNLKCRNANRSALCTSFARVNVSTDRPPDRSSPYQALFETSSSAICVKLPVRTTTPLSKSQYHIGETGQKSRNAGSSVAQPNTPSKTVSWHLVTSAARILIARKLLSTTLPETEATITHVIDSCQVKLGPGYQVLELNTDFEPDRVLVLGNIPPDFGKSRVTEIADNYGEVDAIELRLPSGVTTCSVALIHFKSSAAALRALHQLDGLTLSGFQLFACLQSTSSSHSGEHLNNSVKAVWKAPSMSAYAKYDTFEEACKTLRRLDDAVVLGRCLSASHHLNDQSAKGFSLRVDGLSPFASMADIINALGCRHIILSHCNYTSLQASLDCVKKLLEKNAPLKQFEVIESFSSGQNVIVRATYFRPSDAIESKNRLHGHRLSELGGVSLRIHYNQLLLSHAHVAIFEVIEPALKKLKVKASASRTPISLRWSPSKADKDAMCIFLEGEHVPSLALVKSELEGILRGDLVLSPDGIPLWHRFFAQPSGQSFLSDCHSSSGALVWCDSKKGTLRIFGSQAARQRSLSCIDLKLKQLKQGTKLLALRTRSLHYLLKQGGLARLQGQYGSDVVRMDLLRKLLIVHGDPAAARAAGIEVHNGIHLYHAPHRTRLLQHCPVCGDRLLEPVGLSCGHSYCQDCIRHLLVSARDTNSFPIRCLGDEGKCVTLLSLHVIKALLTPEEDAALMRNAFSCYVLSHAQDLRYCPTPSCSQIYRSSRTANPPLLQCPSCLRFVCTHCHVDHSGMDCRTWRNENDEAFSLWRIEHKVKSCPTCKASIERIDGCNHLTCRCGTHICWQCLKAFQKGSAVYQHMFQEHGGIGIG